MLIPPSDNSSPLSDKLRAALEAAGIDVNDPDVKIVVHKPVSEDDMEFLESFNPDTASVRDLIRYRNLRDDRLEMTGVMMNAAIEAKESGIEYPQNQGIPTITLPASVVLEAARVVESYHEHLITNLDRLIERRSNYRNN